MMMGSSVLAANEAKINPQVFEVTNLIVTGSSFNETEVINKTAVEKLALNVIWKSNLVIHPGTLAGSSSVTPFPDDVEAKKIANGETIEIKNWTGLKQQIQVDFVNHNKLKITSELKFSEKDGDRKSKKTFTYYDINTTMIIKNDEALVIRLPDQSEGKIARAFIIIPKTSSNTAPIQKHE